MKRPNRRLIVAAAASLLITGAAVALNSSASPHYALPDHHLTPGATLPVTTAALCTPGYTATVRVGLTPAEQAQVDRAYHWQHRAGAQEYDHLIPLEVGGANGIKNIWPQPIKEAHVKDGLENRLHALVCSRQLALAAAQACIRDDWVSCWRRYGQGH